MLAPTGVALIWTMVLKGGNAVDDGGGGARRDGWVGVWGKVLLFLGVHLWRVG